jgi:hypothetical protein
VLAAFLEPDSGISRAQCVAMLSRIFLWPSIAQGPEAARDIVRRARGIIISWQPTQAEFDQRFELLES